jgi:hypothetical protein
LTVWFLNELVDVDGPAIDAVNELIGQHNAVQNELEDRQG